MQKVLLYFFDEATRDETEIIAEVSDKVVFVEAKTNGVVVDIPEAIKAHGGVSHLSEVAYEKADEQEEKEEYERQMRWSV